MPRQSFKLLVIMPYLSLKGRLDILGFSFLSAKNNLPTYISDPDLLAHIQKILSTYKSPSGHPVGNGTVVTYSGNSFSKLQARTMNKLYDIRSALIFASFLKNNSWSFTTTDNFELVFQRFNVGDDGLALQGGAMHGILVGGLTISGTVFTTPSHIYVSTSNNSFEPNVLYALIECIKQQDTNPGCSAIIRSLRSFSSANRNSPEIDEASRVLSLITAFELLFGVSSRAQFRANVLRYSEELAPQNYPYLEVNTANGSSRPITVAGIQVWAEEFYKLRHKIIHANLVTYEDYRFKDITGNLFSNNNPHIAIAIEVYAVCLTNKLRELGLLQDYHLVITEKRNYHSTDRNLMNIQNKEFTIVDRHLHDILSGVVSSSNP